ncbi:hypothetical protein CLF_104609 [Clonorchis sinensis]|uniref:Uncharacterized protein n=1 Tax=Clonorchis sinensis TaxID=79923 RepID=G7YNW3_CLOSI|nr:hypothetical protein CLF_104609 [Clonorchis sinensis]
MNNKSLSLTYLVQSGNKTGATTREIDNGRTESAGGVRPAIVQFWAVPLMYYVITANLQVNTLGYIRYQYETTLPVRDDSGHLDSPSIAFMPQEVFRDFISLLTRTQDHSAVKGLSIAQADRKLEINLRAEGAPWQQKFRGDCNKGCIVFVYHNQHYDALEDLRSSIDGSASLYP